MAIIGFVWLVLAVINFAGHKAGMNLETSRIFPLSVFEPKLHRAGLPYVAAFVVVLLAWLRYGARIPTVATLAIGMALVVLGNLAQGSFYAAFIQPFVAGNIQYYHDALGVRDWHSFLSNFNTLQAQLENHGRTHPPFAVLLHFLLLGPAYDRTTLMAVTFSLVGLAGIPLVWGGVRILGSNARRADELAILYSVVPAINIYAIVCLDSVIATLSALFMLATAAIMVGRPLRWTLPLFAFSIIAINLLTFGGVFFIAIAGLLAMRELLIAKKLRLTIALGSTLLVAAIGIVVLEHFYGYSHVRSFLLASRLENPDGFRGFGDPINYVMTRLNDICELALFLSLATLATLFRRRIVGAFSFREDDGDAVFATAFFVLLLMFVMGAFKKGETARACLFFYPFIMLRLRKVPDDALRSLILFAGLQSIAMQLAGSYFW